MFFEKSKKEKDSNRTSLLDCASWILTVFRLATGTLGFIQVTAEPLHTSNIFRELLSNTAFQCTQSAMEVRN